MQHMKSDYPNLYFLAVRMNPMDPEAHTVVIYPEAPVETGYGLKTRRFYSLSPPTIIMISNFKICDIINSSQDVN
jgi:hypothetical protein